MKLPPLCAVVLLAACSALAAGQEILPDKIAARLTSRTPPRVPANAEQVIATVLARPDPETFFNRYVFALQRESAKLLTPAQAKSLETLLARYAPLRARWHDERNTLRCKFNEVQWQYAAASEAEAPALRAELHRWMALRMEWSLREELLYHELDRAVWALLDQTQRAHILTGDWRDHAKMTLGHERANATRRLIEKALGAPAESAEFGRANELWEKERAPLHQSLRLAEETARKVGFAMDLNSPALIEVVTTRANDAYARVYLAEADAYRRLVQAGYPHPERASQTAAQESWSEAPRRFTRGAADLIAALQATGSESAWQPLFNGKDLAGWQPVNVAADTFTVRDGMIVCSGKPHGFLATTKVYENFELELEWRHLVPGGNSGLLLWAENLPAVGAFFPRSIEVQIIDAGKQGDPPQRFTAGDIFGIRGGKTTPQGPNPANGRRSRPTENRARLSPEWNHYRVVCQDGIIRLSINGQEVSSAINAVPRAGSICLECEGSEVHFRNLRIRELPSSRPAVEQTASVYAGFVPLLDGRSFTGWKTDARTAEVWNVDGMIVSAKPRVVGKDLDLWTEKSYRDFELIADWRLPAKPAPRSRATFTPDGLYVVDAKGEQVRKDLLDAGDSGIFFRGYPLAQVNIWSQPMGSGDINELHKDPALPAELRRAMLPSEHADAPFGEWNRFVITVRGQRVTVVLNGRKVIDNVALPNLPVEGPIGLQYHHDAVEFTNLYIREL